MAEITPKLIKELRDKTNAAMGDCKKALVEANGEMEGAIDILRKKGAASAAKRADRTAAEGIIIAKTSNDEKTGVIVEVNCETDFVGRNDQFVEFTNKVATAIFDNDVNSVEDLLKTTVEGETIENLLNDILAKFSEKIGIKRFEKRTTEGSFISYIHAGSKLGVLLELDKAGLSDNAKAMAKDITMQVAAMNPMFVDRTEVTQDVLDKEREIYIQQAVGEGKNEEIATRIADGRIAKFYKEQCLVDQIFVKDSKKVVNDILKEMSADLGSEIKIMKFDRYSLGEE